MLSMSNISSGQAGNYYQKDDYYAREERGEWQGKFAEQQGLKGEIQPQALQDQFDAQKNPERVGADLTFSAPKSCSIAMNLDPKMQADILDAHNKAVQSALDHAEKNFIYSRQTENHVTTPRQTDNMTCAKFNHYVSREQEAQLHTHALILNKTVCADGKTRAISNEKLYENKMFLGQMYRSELARNLQEKGYQVEVTSREKGFFELKGITREQIESHSTRRAEIVNWLKEHAQPGRTGKVAEKAALLTRDAKQTADLGKLRESWRETFKEAGISAKNIEKGTFRPGDPKEVKNTLDGVSRSLSNQSFAFRKEEFERAALREGLGQGITHKDVEKYIQGNMQSKEMVGTTIRNERGFPSQFITTRESMALEKSIFDRVEQGKGKFQGADKAAIQNHLAGTKLSPEQKAAVQHICGSKDGYSAIQGYAGTGKTFMLNEARQVWEKAGYEVKGMAFTGKAKEGLETDAKIESTTIHRHLNNLEKEAGGQKQGEDFTKKQEWNLDNLHKADKPQVWVVDEASMVPNKLMSQLQTAAEKKGAQVVMIGDKRQLQPIGAGNSFSQMVNQGKISTLEMKDIQRQRDPALPDRNDPGHKDYYLRQAVDAAAQGKVKESVEKLSGYTTEIKDRGERFSQIAKDYAGQSAQDRKNSVILTGSNFDRKELNANVREELKARGELQPGQQHEIRGQGNAKETREFSQGDKVIFLQNDRQLGVSNGQTGYIKEIKGDNFKIDSGGKLVDLNMKEYNRLDHGYAMTAHKAQGITENKAFIHVDTSQKQLNSANSYYVDISRARHEARIYTDDKAKLLSSVERQQEKLSAKDFPKAIGRDVQQRAKDPAFRELPKKAQSEIIRGDRNLARAEDQHRKAASLSKKTDICKERAEKYKDSKPRLSERNIREAAKTERKAERTEQKAEKYEQKAGKNYSKAVEINDRSNKKHGTDRELKTTPDRPGVAIGRQEENRTKAEPSRGDQAKEKETRAPHSDQPAKDQAPGREDARQGDEPDRQPLGPQERAEQRTEQKSDLARDPGQAASRPGQEHAQESVVREQGRDFHGVDIMSKDPYSQPEQDQPGQAPDAGQQLVQLAQGTDQPQAPGREEPAAITEPTASREAASQPESAQLDQAPGREDFAPVTGREETPDAPEPEHRPEPESPADGREDPAPDPGQVLEVDRGEDSPEMDQAQEPEQTQETADQAQEEPEHAQGQEPEAPLKDSSPQIEYNETEVKEWLQDRELGSIDDQKEFDMDRELDSPEAPERIDQPEPEPEREGQEKTQEQQPGIQQPEIPEPQISGPSMER